MLLQVEVRNITKQISELNNKLDAVNHLSEPRENSYMMFCRNEDENYTEHIRNLLRNVGSVKTSKTFPSLCRASLETVLFITSYKNYEIIYLHPNCAVQHRRVGLS